MQQKGFKFIHRHGSQYIREIDLLYLIENVLQFLSNNLFPCTRVSFRERRTSYLRSPTQGRRKQILHMAQRFLLHHGRIGLKEPYFLRCSLWADHLNFAPVGIVGDTR